MSDCVDHGRKGFGCGYATAWLHGRTTTLHRVVYYRVTGRMPEVVRHTCDNARCINPDHLIGGTQVQNMADCAERGRLGDCRNFGSANGRTVLSELDVEYIREHYVKGSQLSGVPALAHRFKVGTSQIWRIVNNKQRLTGAEIS